MSSLPESKVLQWGAGWGNILHSVLSGHSKISTFIGTFSYQDNFGTNCRRPRSRATSRAASRAASRNRHCSQPRSRSGSVAGLDSEEGNLIVAAAMANTANIKVCMFAPNQMNVRSDIKAGAGAPDGCPRCGGRVFEAEKVDFFCL